jgi:hypothetical protein
MVPYLDDWLIFGQRVPAQQIQDYLRQAGLTINPEKSVLQPTQQLIYLGLRISIPRHRLTPTRQCLAHLQELITIVPQAFGQDLARIAGYDAWLAWAMGWPRFLATTILQRAVYWLQRLHQRKVLAQPRLLRTPLKSRILYTDATPSQAAALAPGDTPWTFSRHYEDVRPIAFAEMAAAIIGLHQFQHTLRHPTTITLCTNSAVVYHTLLKGTGTTVRYSVLLQNLYIQYYMNKVKSGHGLVVRWVPSEDNLADPLSRGVLLSILNVAIISLISHFRRSAMLLLLTLGN